MLDGLLPRLQVRLVGFVASLKPGNVFRIWYGLRGGAVFSITHVCRAAVAGHSPVYGHRGRWRRRHLDNVSQCAWRNILLDPVAMTASLAVVLLPLLDNSCT
jgi:hypothetical protein